MECLYDHKSEIAVLLLIVVLIYYYYVNYYSKGKKILDHFAKTESVAPPPPPVQSETSGDGEVEEFQPDIKNKFAEENLARYL
jgi:hypothetical protein